MNQVLMWIGDIPTGNCKRIIFLIEERDKSGYWYVMQLKSLSFNHLLEVVRHLNTLLKNRTSFGKNLIEDFLRLRP